MPGFDGTGPLGQGPLTGRGRGYCVVPVGSEKNLLDGYTESRKYSMNSEYPYSINYRRAINCLYNYSYFMQNGINILPQRRLNYASRGFRRFIGSGCGRGMIGRGRRL